MKRKQAILLILAVVLAGLLLTGCGNNKVERQNQYRAEGIKYLEEKEYDLAIVAFQKGLSESVGEVQDAEYDLCFLKAKALYLNGQKEEALEVYNKLIDYKPYSMAYYFRGNFYYAEGEEQKALEDYAKAIELDSTNYDLYISVYDSLMAHNQKTLAEEYMGKALQAEGKKGCNDFNKGRIYYALHDEKKALDFFLQADEDGNMEACYYISLIYMSEENEKADTFFKKFLSSEYATGDRLYELGKLVLSKKQYENAIVYFEAALDKDGMIDKLVLCKKLIACYEKTGRYEEAKTLAEKCQKEWPEDDEISREMDFLKSR